MILHAKRRYVPAPETFERLVVQVYMCYLDVFVFQRIDIDAKTMILTGYFDLAGS